MSFTPCIERPANSRFIVLREEYIQFTGNRCAALLLAFFEYHHNYKLSYVFNQQELADEGKIDYTYKEADLYQQHSLKTIENGIMNEYRRETISEAINLLIEKGALVLIREAVYKANQARQYLFLPDTLNTFIKTEYVRSRKIDYGRDRKIDTKDIKDTNKTDDKGKDSLSSDGVGTPKVEVKETLQRRARKHPLFPSDMIGDIFQHWNNYCNLPSHRIDPNSKQFTNSILAITKALRKHSPETIKFAMTKYSEFLNAPDTTINTSHTGCKVSLSEFFKFTDFTNTKLEELTRKGMSVFDFDAWFDVCLQPLSDILTKFARYDKDDNPKITESLQKEYETRISDKLSTADKNNFIRSAKRVLQFHSKNKEKINWNSCLREKISVPTFAKRIIDACIDSANGDTSIIATSWLCTDTMFEVRLPKYLKKIGLVTADDFKSKTKFEAKTQTVVKKGYDPGYTDGEIE